MPGTEHALRTPKSISDAAKKAELEGRKLFGIKGTSTLSKIVDLPLGAPIDYMHCVLEGVVKQLLNLWNSFLFRPSF